MRRYGIPVAVLVALGVAGYVGCTVIDSEGGETVLGNMVPACQKCDDSKRDSGFEEWMLGDCANGLRARGVADVEDRPRRIKEYVTRFGYLVAPLEDRLDDAERTALKEIRDRAESLREDMDGLIERYRKRTEQT